MIHFRVRNAEQVGAALRAFPPQLQRRITQDALQRAFRPIADEVQRAAPLGTEPTRKTRRLAGGRAQAYDYGRLRQNIRVRPASARTAQKGVRIPTVRLSTGRAFWGYFLEWGTVRMRARPFFFAAVRRGIPLFQAAVTEAFVRAINDAAAAVNLPTRRR